MIDTLSAAGYEAYVVGGAVRDAVLGGVPDDWDVTTSAPVKVVQGCFKKHFDTGIKHGTVTVLCGRKTVEVTTYRIDGRYSDNRRPESVMFTDRLSEDLKRRDFTVNALAYNGENGIVDLFGGIDDIKNKVIRCVGDPDRRFGEDALRIMRAVRFSSRLGFEIEEKTFESVKKNVGLLKNISAERIYSELKKTLLCGGGVEILYESGIIDTILPNAQNNAKAVENVPCAVETKLAALLFGMSAAQRKDAMTGLKTDNKTKKAVLGILSLFDENISSDDICVRQTLSVYGADVFLKFLDLMSALGRDTDEFFEIYERVKNDPVSVSDLAVGGKDMAKIGITGTETGSMLKFLLSEVIKNPSLNDRERLLDMAKTKKSCNIS